MAPFINLTPIIAACIAHQFTDFYTATITVIGLCILQIPIRILLNSLHKESTAGYIDLIPTITYYIMYQFTNWYIAAFTTFGIAYSIFLLSNSFKLDPKNPIPVESWFRMFILTGLGTTTLIAKNHHPVKYNLFVGYIFLLILAIANLIKDKLLRQHPTKLNKIRLY